MNFKKMFTKKQAIILGTVIALLIGINIIFYTLKTSNAELSEDKGVETTTEVSDKVYVRQQIKKELSGESYYTTISYTVTAIDPQVKYVMVETKSTTYSYPIYTKLDAMSMGTVTVATDLELGSMVEDFTTTVTFYGFDTVSGEMVELDLRDTTAKIDAVTAPVTKKGLSKEYSSGMRKWVAPETGTYTIQLWGASGNYYPTYNKSNAGRGGYVSGDVDLNKGDVLYIYTGGNSSRLYGCDPNDPNNTCFDAVSFNGGSTALGYSGHHYMSSGGGATDIRYFGSYVPTSAELAWNSTLGLRSRVMVAGGGGGTLRQQAVTDSGEFFEQLSAGGSAGGLIGYSPMATWYSGGAAHGTPTHYYDAPYTLGGGQTSGGTGGGICYVSVSNGGFGKGGNGGNSVTFPDNLGQCKSDIYNKTGNMFDEYLYALGNIGGGGGGGWYGGGGGGAIQDCHSGGAGGSSYVSGHQGSVGVDENGNPICTSNAAITDVNCSYSNTGLKFTNTTMIDGDGYNWTTSKGSYTGMPHPNGTTTIPGNEGNGVAKITLKEKKECTTCGADVVLTKYRKTADGLETTQKITRSLEESVAEGEHGAIYELRYASDDTLAIDSNGNGLYETDETGELRIENLVMGIKYYLVEKEAPKGYSLNTQKYYFTVQSQTQEVHINAYDTEKPVNMILKKTNINNVALEGTVFELWRKQYDEETWRPETSDKLMATLTADEFGYITYENLPWGDYYIRETETKKGYILMDDIPFTVDINNFGQILEFSNINEQIPGKVHLLKTAEADKSLTLAGAVYNLYYSESGALYRENLVTDENGELLITDLPWGSYYLKEIQAPEGYGLSEEKVRFSISNNTVGLDKTGKEIIQELDATDPDISKAVTINKKIKISDIVFSHGAPTFIFKLDGEDFRGNTHTYYRQITFTENYVNDYVKNHPDDEYISQDVTITGLIKGIYTLEELSTVRYQFDGISDVTSGTVEGQKVTFDLTRDDGPNGSATYQNKITDQGDENHTNQLTNVIKICKKVTYITAKFDQVSDTAYDRGSTIIGQDVLLTLTYDDGSTENIRSDDTVVSPTIPLDQDGNVTFDVTYPDPCSGRDRYTTFTVKLYAAAVDYGYTGRTEEFIVPDGIPAISATITLWGAQGGNESCGGWGGYGGMIKAKVNLVANETIYVNVGSSGSKNCTPVFNGGGGWPVGGDSAGGGGGTDIRIGGNEIKDRVLVAGGGGGGSNDVGQTDNQHWGLCRTGSAGAGGNCQFRSAGTLFYGGAPYSQNPYATGQSDKDINAGCGGGGYYGGAPSVVNNPSLGSSGGSSYFNTDYGTLVQETCGANGNHINWETPSNGKANIYYFYMKAVED